MEVSGEIFAPAALLLGEIAQIAPPPQYTLHRCLGSPQRRSGSGGEKNPCPCRELNPGRPARSTDSVITELPRFLTDGINFEFIFPLWKFLSHSKETSYIEGVWGPVSKDLFIIEKERGMKKIEKTAK
jgi:hypothetical protein